jgi:hypothetical protein
VWCGEVNGTLLNWRCYFIAVRPNPAVLCGGECPDYPSYNYYTEISIEPIGGAELCEETDETAIDPEAVGKVFKWCEAPCPGARVRATLVTPGGVCVSETDIPFPVDTCPDTPA